MDLKEIGWKGVDWIRLTPDMDKRWDVVNMVMYLWVLYHGRSFLTSLGPVHFSRPCWLVGWLVLCL
jgi:hypothetical protein